MSNPHSPTLYTILENRIFSVIRVISFNNISSMFFLDGRSKIKTSIATNYQTKIRGETAKMDLKNHIIQLAIGLLKSVGKEPEVGIG